MDKHRGGIRSTLESRYGFAIPSRSDFQANPNPYDHHSPSQLILTPEESADEEAYELKSLSKDKKNKAPAVDATESEEEDDDDDERENYGLVHQRPRQASAQSFELFSPGEEKTVIKTFDKRLVSFMAFLYLLSFLDRSNIGNARIAGLAEDLRLTSSQYEWLLTGFYITYIVFEWMTLMYRYVPPHIYISLCVLCWGIIASLQAVTMSFSGLLFLRVLLGIGEAAFGPGVPFYLSFFYKREELALRTGLFISAAPLATSFASSLAWVITKISEKGPIAPWRMLFLVEGFPSVIVAIWAWKLLPDRPESASYLTRRQKRVARLRLRRERGSKEDFTEIKEATGREITRTLLDPKCYLGAIMFFCSNVAFSSLPVFLPTIINQMGYSRLRSQALSTPPYLLSFITVVATAYYSDRSRARSPYLFFHSLISSLAYFLLSMPNLPLTLHYLLLFPAASGFFSAVTLIITWTLNNQRSETGRGAGMAILNVIGQCGPLVGTRLFPDEDAQDGYVRGMRVCAFSMLIVGLVAWGLRGWLIRENVRERKVGWRYML